MGEELITHLAFNHQRATNMVGLDSHWGYLLDTSC